MKKIFAAAAALLLLVCAGCGGGKSSAAVSSGPAYSLPDEALRAAITARLTGDAETYIGLIDLNYVGVVRSAIMKSMVPNSHIADVVTTVESFGETRELTDADSIKSAYSGYTDAPVVMPERVMYADARVVSTFTYDGAARTLDETMTAVMTEFGGSWYLLDLYYPDEQQN